MKLRQSAYDAAFREIARQAQRLTRPGVVGTWRTWDGTPDSDDPAATPAMPWVRLTPGAISFAREASGGDESEDLGQAEMSIGVEVANEGWSPEAVWAVWGEIRDALFSDDDTIRDARDAALLAVGVVDLLEPEPVSTRGPESFQNGVVSGEGRIVAIIHLET